jgi:hypothetical protein
MDFNSLTELCMCHYLYEVTKLLYISVKHMYTGKNGAKERDEHNNNVDLNPLQRSEI